MSMMCSTPERPERYRSARRWWLALGVLAGVVGAIAVTLAIARVTAELRQILTPAAVATVLGETLQRPVRVESLTIHPWRGRLEATGVAIAAGPDWSRGTLLRVGRLTVGIGVSSVWRREVVLSRIRLEDVDLDYTASDGGDALAWPERFPERVALGPVTALIGTIEVARARLAYRDASGDTSVAIDGAAVTAHPDAGTLALTVTATRLRVLALGIEETVQEVDVRGRLRGEQAIIDRLVLRWHGQPLRITGEVAALLGAPAMALQIEGRVALAPIAERLGAPGRVEGVATLTGSVRGPVIGPSLSLQVTVPELRSVGIPARHVRASVAWDGATLTVADARAHALGGEVSGALTLPARAPGDSRLGLRLHDVSLAALADLAGSSIELGGVVSLDGELHGDLRRPAEGRGRADLEARGVPLPGVARAGPGRLRLTARLDDGTVEITRGEASWPGLAMTVSGIAGRVKPAHRAVALQGVLTADLARAAAVWEQRGLRGQITLAASVDGSWDAPRVTGQLRSPQLDVAGISLTAVAVRAEAKGRTLRIVDSAGTLGASRLHASGILAVPAPLALGAAELRELQLALDVRSPAFRIEDLSPWLPANAPVTGRAAVELRVTGTPAAWQATGQVQAPRIAARGERIERLTARLEAAPDGLVIPWAAATIRGTGVTAAGRVNWDGSGTARLATGAVDLAALSDLPPGLDLRGQARLSVEVSRRVGDALRASGVVAAEGVAVGDLRLGTGALQATLARGRLHADLSFPGSRVTGTVRGGIAEGAALDVQLTARDLELASLLRHLLPDAAGDVHAVASVAAELRVPLHDPASSIGTVRLEPVRLAAAGETWTAPEPIVVSREPSLTRLQRLRLESRLGAVSAHGLVTDTGRIDFTARGKLPLAALAALRPELRDAAGTLQVTARVTGDRTAPAVSGEGRISGGRVTLSAWDQVLRDLDARFVVSPAEIRVTEASATVSGGTVRARGEAVLQGWRPAAYRVAAEARGVGFAPVQDLQAAWDADLELVGAADRAQLRGDVRLVRGRYARDLSVLRLLLERRPAATPAAGEPGLRLDLRVALGDQLLVRTRLARFRTDGTLLVQGTPSAPAIFGTLHAHDGQLIFRRQAFTLTSATARFVDPRRIDPLLDVRGEARIRGYDVSLHISGRGDDLQVRLASSPPLPEEDVLSLVVLGATREQLGRAGAGALVGEMAGLLVQDLFGVQSDRAGLDVLELQTEEAGGRTLRVGKQLTPRTLLVYSQGLEASDRQRLRVEYQVFGPLVVAGEQDFRGGFGADVLLRLRFR